MRYGHHNCQTDLHVGVNEIDPKMEKNYADMVNAQVVGPRELADGIRLVSPVQDESQAGE